MDVRPNPWALLLWIVILPLLWFILARAGRVSKPGSQYAELDQLLRAGRRLAVRMATRTALVSIAILLALVVALAFVGPVLLARPSQLGFVGGVIVSGFSAYGWGIKSRETGQGPSHHP